MSTLRVTAGPINGQRFELGERTTMGRAPDNTVVLTDHLVSRYHAEVVKDTNAFELRDLGSKNGIKVNGVLTSEHRLRPGDTVKVGKTSFLFEVPQEFKAARFSDTMVHMVSVGEQEIEAFDESELSEAPDLGRTDIIVKLGQLMDGSGEELPAMLEDVLRHTMEMLEATGGSIVLHSSTGDVRPLVAIQERGDLRLPRDAVRSVLQDGALVITAAFDAPESNEDEEGGAELRSRRAVLAPLRRRDQVLGAVHLVRPEGEEYAPHDLARLLVIARLVSGVIRYAIHMDQLMIARQDTPVEPYIGNTSIANSVRERIRRVAANDSTVLLTGETGTGKELVAKLIHAHSERANRPFVTIDCSAIPENLLESELFGHESGAFTGADRLKRGKVEMAEGGTLFLDEIGELQVELQPKLLRFMEEFVFYRVGGVRPIQSDVRIIAATNRNLQLAVQQGRFRQDLLFRLNVMPINLPPLRMRFEDLRVLVDHFAPRIASKLGKPFLGLLDEGWELIERYPWPGNVRELRHSLERALILSDDGILRPEHFQLNLPERDTSSSTATPTEMEQTQPGSGGPRTNGPVTLAEAEADAIARALQFAGGNRVKAAAMLKIHRNTLAKKIQDYKIEV